MAEELLEMYTMATGKKPDADIELFAESGEEQPLRFIDGEVRIPDLADRS